MTDSDRDAVYGSILRGGDPISGPWHMEIDPVDVCNARCFFCNNADSRRGDAVLPWDVLRRVLLEGAGRGLRSVRLSGGGEPLIYPRWLDMVGLLRDLGIALDIVTTNGIALEGAVADSLLEHPPWVLGVSLNYGDRESYRGAMGVDGFDRVCGNVGRFCAESARRGLSDRCHLHLKVAFTRATARDLDGVFSLAKSLGVDALSLQSLTGLAPEMRLDAGEREAAGEALGRLRSEYANDFMLFLGLEEEGVDVCGSTGGAGRGIFCLLPWYSLTVRAKGLVYPCCSLMTDPGIVPLGDVTGQSLESIWHGGAFRRCRREVRDAMILGGPLPGWGWRCRHTSMMCWRADGCPIAALPLCDDSGDRFRGVVDAIRRSPSGRWKRWTSSVLRRGLDAVGRRGA